MSILKIEEKKQGIDWSWLKLSASKMIEMFQEPFDAQKVAEACSKKNFDNPESKYYKMTPDDIVLSWNAKGEESMHYGRLSDEYIENLLEKTDKDMQLWKLNNNFDYDKRLQDNAKSFDQFHEYASKDWEFIDREQPVYYLLEKEKAIISGRFDAVLQNKSTGKFAIIDYKTSDIISKIPTKWTPKLFGPLYKYPALNWYTYTVQVYFYKKAMAERGYFPEGTSLDDISCWIVNIPGKPVDESGSMFEVVNPAFLYDDALMDKVIEFAVKKYKLEIQEDNEAD